MQIPLVLIPAVLVLVTAAIVQKFIENETSIVIGVPILPSPLPYTAYHDVVTNTAHFIPNIAQPEGLLEHDGYIYTATREGNIYRASVETGKSEVFATVDGAPLGLAYHPQSDSLLICSPGSGVLTGILQVDMKSREVKVLCDKAEGEHMVFVDDVDVDVNTGDIYFTDATVVDPTFGGPVLASRVELLGVPTGRVVKYSWHKHLQHAKAATPNHQLLQGEVIKSDMLFSNGVAVDSKAQKVYVCETGQYRVHEYDIKTKKWSIAVSNLPGWPDGVSLETRDDGSAYLWVALFGPRDNVVDTILHKYPIFKRLMKAFPALLPTATPHGGFVSVDTKTGNIEMYQVDETGNNLAATTDVLCFKNTVYIGSLQKDFVGRFPLG